MPIIDSNEKPSSILSSVISTISDTKTHGISNIIKSKSRLLRIIWVLCFSLSATYCIYQITNNIITYLKFATIHNNYVVYESPTQFPALVICNLNAYDDNTAKKDIENILTMNNISSNKYNKSIDYVENALLLFKANLDQKAINGFFDQWYNGFLLEQMLISCKFYGEDCDINDSYYYHDFDYGNCFRFNGGLVNKAGHQINNPIKQNIKMVSKIGSDNGLRLELFTGNIRLQQQFNYKNGIRVLVHNQSIEIFTNFEGIDVPTGSLTNIAMTKTFINHLPSPYTSNCLDTSNVDWNQNDILRFMKKSFKIGDYNQKHCLKVCYQRFIIDKCNCFDLKYPLKSDSDIQSCRTLNHINCVKNANHEYYVVNQDSICYPKCPLECTEVIYQLKTNQATYPNAWYADRLLNDTNFIKLVVNNSGQNTTALPEPDYESLTHTLLMINLYYEEMFYNYINETPGMNFELMLACIGGNMGLFLGCSLLFFVELIEILFNVINILIFKKFKTKN
jgi:hypothetical protein